MTPEEHKRIVRSTLAKMPFSHAPRPKTSMDHAADKAFQMSEAIHRMVKPILQAGGYADRDALKDTVIRMHLDLIIHFSKEELENLSVMLLSDLMMERIDASPYGGDKPDLLSGK